MKDLLGREVNVGDIVICTVSKYEELAECRVTRLTPLCAFCEPLNPEKVPYRSRKGMLKRSWQLYKIDNGN